MSQLCAVDLAHSEILGDVPILGLAWAAPRIGNSALADWVKERANLRILRVRIPIDNVCNSELTWPNKLKDRSPTHGAKNVEGPAYAGIAKMYL